MDHRQMPPAGLPRPDEQTFDGTVAALVASIMFIANVKAAREGLMIGGSPATGLVLRIPMQILFIWLAWWSTRAKARR